MYKTLFALKVTFHFTFMENHEKLGDTSNKKSLQYKTKSLIQT